LTTSFPVAEGQIPVYHSMLNTGRPYAGQEASKFMSNYLDIPNAPLYPFGFGLTYTTFEYSNLSLSTTMMRPSDKVVVSVNIKNTGKKAGTETVQLYIQDVVGSISRPVKELKGFNKVSLAPGESKIVKFEISEELLKFYNSQLEFKSEAGKFKVFVGGNSRDLITGEFELTK